MKLGNAFKQEFVQVDDKNRFYYMLQQMQSNRWKITLVVFKFESKTPGRVMSPLAKEGLVPV